jgi:hypothetical protein
MNLLCNFLKSAIFSSLLGQVFSSAPYPQTSSVCIRLLTGQTKFRTHTKKTTDGMTVLYSHNIFGFRQQLRLD